MLFNVFIVRFDNCLNMGPDGNTGMCSLGFVSSQLGTSDELTVAILKTPIIKYPVSCFVHHCQDVGQQLIAVISLQESFSSRSGYCTYSTRPPTYWCCHSFSAESGFASRLSYWPRNATKFSVSLGIMSPRRSTSRTNPKLMSVRHKKITHSAE